MRARTALPLYPGGQDNVLISPGRVARLTCYVLAVPISDLQRKLRDFAVERNWEQFHSPKNLVMALVGEAGELTEIFQWLTPEQSYQVLADPDRAEHVREEIADVFAYLLRLADVLGLDLEASMTEKIIKNASKYPVDAASGPNSGVGLGQVPM